LLLGFILLIASVTDILRHKVYNWLTFPALGLGLGLNAAWQQLPGLWGGCAGLLVGGLLFFPAFFWGGMGAGDVKLMAVVGAFMGWVFVINAALYAAVIGGVLAAAWLLIRGELLPAVKRIGRFLYSVFRPHLKIEPLSRKYPIPFAVIIFAGTVAAFFLPPILVLP